MKADVDIGRRQNCEAGAGGRLAGAKPATGASIVRSRLFIKYVALFVTVVVLALVANGVFEIWFSYREHKASLIRIQREQAEAAAAKIEQFIKEIESQVGWTTQLPWSAARSSSGASMRCGCCARCPPSPNSPRSMPRAMSGSGCRGSPWTWSAAASTSPRIRNSPRRWRTRSITARSTSAANPSPT